MISIPPAPLLLPVNDVVRPSEHEPSDEADDGQADYAIENSPKAERGGGLDRLQVEAVHECTEEIERRIGCEREGDGAQSAYERQSYGQGDPGPQGVYFVIV